MASQESLPPMRSLSESVVRGAIPLFRRASAGWLLIGFMVLLSWLGPRLILVWFDLAVERRDSGWDVFLTSWRELQASAGIRTVMTATYWSCLAGAFRNAVRYSQTGELKAGDFIGGFMGGFLLFIPAGLYEAIMPKHIVTHDLISLLFGPCVPWGVACLTAMGAGVPMLKVPQTALQLVRRQTPRWMAMELVFSIISVIFLPISFIFRPLTVAVSAKDRLRVLSESLSSPAP